MNDLVVAIGVVLFPGVIATIIADKIIIHMKPWGSFKYGIYSFILGVFCYAGLQIVAFLQELFPAACQTMSSLQLPLDTWNIIADSKSSVDLVEVFLATLLSVPVAFLSAYLVNHKIVNRLAKRCGVSKKFGDENLYSFYLNAQEIDWVYVRDIERKLTYQGRVFSFSENDAVQEIVLSEVTVYGYDDSDEYYSVPTIYLCRVCGSLIIESIPQDLLEKVDGKKATK